MDQKHTAATIGGRREAYYRALLEEQEASGRSLRAFAAERGVSQWTLYEWRRKLRGKRRTCRSATRFVAVDVVGGSRVQGGSLEVVLADGMCVREPGDTPSERLVELVRALRSC